MLQIKSLVVLALVSVASLGYVQTAQAQDNFSSERMAGYIKSQGHKAEIKRFQNGAETVVMVLEKDGNRYVIEAEYSLDKKNINFLCPLGNSVPEVSGAQLLALMKKSYEICPVHFVYRDADKRICMEFCNINPMGLNDTVFQRIVDILCKNIVDTQAQWDASRWPLSGSPTAQPQTTPVLPSPGPTGPTGPTGPQTPAVQPQPIPAPAGVSLVNTIWVGNENLGSYGRLEFRFQANGQVMMIDNDGSTMGTYTIQNNVVVLTFHNGKVAYAGNINGSTMSGKAGNTAGAVWTFSVSR